MDDTDARVSLRDKLRLTRALTKIPIRVSITGTRGKSSQAYLMTNALKDRDLWAVAKITGDLPFFMDRDGVCNILRKNKRPVFLDETAILSNLCEEARSFPDAVVLENQAIQPYTMYAFHELYSQPNYIIVTNIRKDHQEFLGRTKADIAAAYGKSFARAKRIISGDQDPETNRILMRYAKKMGAKFHTVEIPESLQDIPGAENVYVAQKFLELASMDFPEFGDLRMLSADVEAHVNLIKSMMTLHPSTMGIEWFDGAKLNDTDSTEIVIDYLMKNNPDRKFVVMAFFRGDRPARTVTFCEYFNTMLDSDRVSAVYMAGEGAEYVLNRLKGSIRDKAIVVQDTTLAASQVLNRVKAEGSALVTVANAVSPFMRHVRKSLTMKSESHVIYQNTGPKLPVTQPSTRDLLTPKEREFVHREPTGVLKPTGIRVMNGARTSQWSVRSLRMRRIKSKGRIPPMRPGNLIR